MTHKCFDEDVRHVSNGLADHTLCSVFEAFQKTGGLLTARNKWAMAHLSITTSKTSEKLVPTIIAVGSKTSQRQWFGDRWSNNVAFRSRAPLDLELEAAAAPAYCQAAAGTPYYGIAVFDAKRSNGFKASTDRITVDRLVFPIRFDPGGPVFCAYMGCVLSQT